MDKLFDKNFRSIFFLIILFELLSFAVYLFPGLSNWLFIILAIVAFIVTLIKLEYGIYLLLAELLLTSKGYLFYFEYQGVTISFRIALWLIIISVWLALKLIDWFKNKKIDLALVKSRFFPYYLGLFIFIFASLINGLINALINRTEFSNLFFDFNAWLYFLLIFPIYDAFNNKPNLKVIFQIFLASLSWLSLETLGLLYAFSHNFSLAIFELYGWLRISGVGEITLIQGGFYRIFLQAQIFVLIGIFIYLFYLSRTLNQKINDKKSLIIVSLCLATLLATILVSFSRSFWFGLFGGLICWWLLDILVIKIKFRQFIFKNVLLLGALLFSVILVVIIVKFPLPEPTGGFATTEILALRAGQISDEAAAASRWQLLPKLWQKIMEQPIFGSGFGATVTYQTNDPRILESNPTGLYTSYAFEWGWLDLWLKLGLLGVLIYLYLIFQLIYRVLSKKFAPVQNYPLLLSLITGIIVIALVNIFSPYLNHPLGIGYLILATYLIDYYTEGKALA